MSKEMTTSKRRLVLALMAPMLALAAGACTTSEWEKQDNFLHRADHWVESRWIVEEHSYPPAQLALGARRAAVSDRVIFAPGSSRLSPDQRDALVRFLGSVGARRGESALISLSPAGGRALASRRAASIAAVLHRNGLRVTRSFGPEPVPHVATVTISRVVATGPDCPEWQLLMKKNVVVEHRPRFGCFNASSLAASVARPQDLVVGRRPGPSDAQTLDKGLQNLREGKYDTKPDPVTTGTKAGGQ